MPATSVWWASAIAFDTVRPVRTSAPKRRKRAKKPARKTKVKRCGRPLSPQCRSVLIDRLELAVERGQIDMTDDHDPVDALCVTAGEYALLLRLLFPEDYVRPERPVASATDTAPGSADRIAEYQRRAARGEQLYHASDATAHKAHDRGLAIAQRANGTGAKVLGWADEVED